MQKSLTNSPCKDAPIKQIPFFNLRFSINVTIFKNAAIVKYLFLMKFHLFLISDYFYRLQITNILTAGLNLFLALQILEVEENDGVQEYVRFITESSLMRQDLL